MDSISSSNSYHWNRYYWYEGEESETGTRAADKTGTKGRTKAGTEARAEAKAKVLLQ